jgi:hypothetical protein
MKTLFGAVAGALAFGAVLVAYDLGVHQTLNQGAFNQGAAALSAGYQPGQPYAVQAGQTGFVSPYMPYATPFAAQYPYGAGAPVSGYGVPQYVNQPVVTTQPAVRRYASQNNYVTDRVSAPKRSWQKSALLIGGSAAGAAGVGALIHGKKGAGIGALLGGGAAALFDQITR